MPKEREPHQEETSQQPIEKLAAFLQGEKRWLTADDFVKTVIYKYEEQTTSEKGLLATLINRHEARIQPGSPQAEDAQRFANDVFPLYLEEAKTEYKAAQVIQKDFIRISKERRIHKPNPKLSYSEIRQAEIEARDERILEILELCPTHRDKDIAKAVNMSVNSLKKRLTKLRNEGINIPYERQRKKQPTVVFENPPGVS